MKERKARHDSLLITRYSLGWILSLRYAPFRMTKATVSFRAKRGIHTNFGFFLLG